MDHNVRSLATHCSFRPLAAIQRLNKHNNIFRNALKSSGRAIATAGVVGFMSGGIRTVAMSGGYAPRANASSSISRGGGSTDNGPAITVTQALLFLNVVMFGAQMASKELLTLWGIKVNKLIIAGQWWRLMTPAFLHGNLMHLVVNSISLNNLGPSVETLCGGKRMLAVYLLAAFTGNIASFFGSQAPSLGASGAVFGVGGALAMYFYQNKDLYGKQADRVLNQLWQTLLINVVYGLTNPRIDNWGHLGGLAGGALAAYLLGPRYKVATVPGERGKYLVDRPPIGLLASPPKQIR